MIGLALLSCAQPAGANAPPAPQCHYVNVASLPVTTVKNHIVVQGSINGKATEMMIDSGAQFTTLTSQGAENLGLTLLHSGVSSIGVGGESDTYEVVVDDMALDKFHTKSHKRLLVNMDAEVPYNVIVGTNILFNADVEFNLAQHYVKLFEPSGCDDTFLAYWDKNAADAPLLEMSSKNLLQVVTAEINGQKIRAVIDSGAQYSMINLAWAARLGMTTQSSGVKKFGATRGIGKHKTETWIGQFDSFTLGGETVNNPALLMADLWGAARSDSNTAARSDFVNEQPDMLLGADFLRAHRVLLALSQKRIYFSYIGGNVFGAATGSLSNANVNRFTKSD